MEALDDEAVPNEEVCAESEEEEKMEEVEDSSEGSDEDLYTGSTNCVQCKKMCKEWTSNLVDCKNS